MSCLICSTSLIDLSVGGVRLGNGLRNHPFSIDGSGNNGKLSDHLYVFFITSKLLKLGDDQCLKIISALAEKLERFLCQVCEEIVGEGIKLHFKVLSLQKELERLSEKLVGIVKESFKEDGRGDVAPFLLRQVGGDDSEVKTEEDSGCVAVDDGLLDESGYEHLECEVQVEEDQLENGPRRTRKRQVVYDSPDEGSDSDYVPEKEEPRRPRVIGRRKGKKVANSSQRGKSKYRKIHIDFSKSGFSCTFCQSFYETARGFKSHLIAHEESEKLDHKYDCRICNHPNLSEDKLRRHLRLKHDSQPNTCKICGYVGCRRWIYEKHMLDKHNIKVWIPIDKKEDANDAADAETPPCVISDAQDTESLKNCRVENDIFICTVCNANCPTIDAFKMHVKAHQLSDLMGNLFDCTICHYPFTTERTLRYHMSKAHKGQAPVRNHDFPINLDQGVLGEAAVQENGPAMLRCKRCGSEYHTLVGFRRHGKVHAKSDSQLNQFDCSICKFPNLSADTLRRHLGMIHNKNLNQITTEARPDIGTTDSEKMLQETPEVDDSDVDEWLPSPQQEESEVSDAMDDSDADDEIRKLNSSGGSKTEALLSLHCEKCNVTYKSPRGIKSHMEDHKASISLTHKYDCKKCGFPNGSERRLRCHLKRVHNEVPMRTCPICGYQVLKTQNLKVHMRKHNGSFNINRPGRPPKLSSFKKEGSYECRICHAKYERSGCLKKHMLQHTLNKETGGIYDCDQCKFPCTSEAKLRFHKNLRHEKSKNICKICHKSFGRPNVLARHLRVHEDYDGGIDEKTGNYRCKFCDFQSTLQGLVIHMNIHRDSAEAVVDRPHLCSVCGLGYRTAGTLQKHIRNKHENRFYFSCETCGKGFDSRIKLGDHMQQHKDRKCKEYICSCCGVAYSQQKTLDEHMCRFHPEQEAVTNGNGRRLKPEKEGKHKCKFCKEVFPFKYLLVNHLPTAHKDLYTFKCDLCDKSYMSGSNLRLHKEITHSDGTLSHSCEYCGKTFPHKHYVTCHYKWCKLKKELGKAKKSPSESKPHEPNLEVEVVERSNSDLPGPSSFFKDTSTPVNQLLQNSVLMYPPHYQ